TGVTLNVNVVNDSGEEVYTADLDYGTIGVDSTAENQVFTEGWTPPAEPAIYTVTYSISADTEDEIMENNSVSYSFEVSNGLFAKENGFTRPVTSAPGNWENPDTDPHNIAYGNHFYITNGTGNFVKNVSFGIGNAEEEGMTGRGLVFTLYAWFDDNADGDAQPAERRPVGTTLYFIEGTEAEDDIITIPFPEEGDEPIELVDNTNYLMMMEYFTDDQQDLAFAASETYDYSAMNLATETVEVPRYAGFLGIAADLSGEDYGSAGFGQDIVPVVRMEIGPESDPNAVDDLLADSNKIEVYPNPTSGELNISLDLVERADNATLRVVDVTGRLVQQMQIADVKQQTVNYNVGNLANGTYFLQLITEAGTRTEKFSVNAKK
ncbi:MAG: T9SS type A sorting domain-containing protein, partial [Saprospiraceae bacterium]